MQSWEIQLVGHEAGRQPLAQGREKKHRTHKGHWGPPKSRRVEAPTEALWGCSGLGSSHFPLSGPRKALIKRGPNLISDGEHSYHVTEFRILLPLRRKSQALGCGVC